MINDDIIIVTNVCFTTVLFSEITMMHVDWAHTVLFGVERHNSLGFYFSPLAVPYRGGMNRYLDLSESSEWI
jgi:hypothetical protein